MLTQYDVSSNRIQLEPAASGLCGEPFNNTGAHSMTKFSKSFVANKTRVVVFGHAVSSVVTEIHETRNWIKVQGLMGSFQRGHIQSFTNK